jgi:hypothetical protein
MKMRETGATSSKKATRRERRMKRRREANAKRDHSTPCAATTMLLMPHEPLSLHMR